MRSIFLILLTLCACQSKQKQKSIAILTPTTHPSLEQIALGFTQTMGDNYRIVTFNAQGNKTLMRSEIDEIIRQKFDLVFTIGTMASQMTAKLFLKKGIKTPLVFTCVNDPSILPKMGNMTGVKELLNLKEEIGALITFKPSIKTILLVYNPQEPGLEKDREEIELILKIKNIELMTVEVFHSNEIKAKTAHFIKKADALMVLKDNTVVSGLDALIKLCHQEEIPLMASDLDSPDKGATLGYGVHEIEFGIEGAKKALQILEEEISPKTIPVTAPSNFTLKMSNKEISYAS